MPALSAPAAVCPAGSAPHQGPDPCARVGARTHAAHPLSAQSTFRMTPSRHEKSRYDSAERERRYRVIMADKSPLCTTIIHQLNSTYANRAPHTKCGLIDFYWHRSAPERRRSGQGSAARSYRHALHALLGAFALLFNSPSRKVFSRTSQKITLSNICICFCHVMPSCLSGL